jgi:hypothetical protein
MRLESGQCAINMIQIVFLKLWWLTGQGPVRGEHVTSPDFVDPSSSKFNSKEAVVASRQLICWTDDAS